MALLTLSLFTIIIAYISILHFHRIWNPILLCVSMFLLGMILTKGDCRQKDFETATFWILIGEIFLTGSFLIIQTLFKKKTVVIQTSGNVYDTLVINRLVNINITVSLLALALSTYKVMRVAPSFKDIFVNSTYVRYLYLAEQSNILISIASWILTCSFFVTFIFFPIALQNKVSGSARKLLVVLLIRLLSSLVTMSKAAFLSDMVYFISVYVMILRDKKSEYDFYKKYGSIFGFLVVVLLIVVSFQRNYIGQGKYDSYFNAVIGTLREYISISIEAFGSLLNVTGLKLTHGTLCFRPLVNIFSYFGVGQRLSVVQDSLTNATTANVYTCFGNMFRDFSYPGIVVLSIFFGIFLGAIYNANHKYKISRIVANGIVTMTMFFAYYDLEIIQTVYLFVMIYGLIVDNFLGKWIYKANIS